MERHIYIVRHGQTDYNLKGIVQGRGVDSVLNETGRQQAAAFYAAYGHIPFDIVYTSSMMRTRETVKDFLVNGYRHEQHADLDEIDWGIYEGVAHDPVMHERYLSIIDQWRNNKLHIRIDGGESAADLYQRIDKFVAKLRVAPYEKSLICSHGRSIRVLLCALTGTPLSKMDDFPHANTSLYKLLFNGHTFEIDLFNNTDHLHGAI
jgi:probable phosphoglycerate mutase